MNFNMHKKHEEEYSVTITKDLIKELNDMQECCSSDCNDVADYIILIERPLPMGNSYMAVCANCLKKIGGLY